jgi:hypothetical protein
VQNELKNAVKACKYLGAEENQNMEHKNEKEKLKEVYDRRIIST